MSTLTALKNLSMVRKYAVFGFIREQTQILSLPFIPTMIDYLCLSYYLPEYDFFDKYEENRICLSITQLTATAIHHDEIDQVVAYRPKSGYKDTSIFGYQWIDSLSSKKYRWIFKINKLTYNMEFGITSAVEHQYAFKYSLNKTHGRYHSIELECQPDALTLWEINHGTGNGTRMKREGILRIFGQDKTKEIDAHNYAELVNGSTITLTLKNGVLSFAINDQQLPCKRRIEKGTDIKYRVAVAMIHKGDSVTLTNYTVS